MLPLKLVLDTSVVVSAALKPNGLERTALVFALTPPARLYVSEPILAEYAEVLARRELRIPPGERQPLIDLIAQRSQRVVAGRTLAVCHDPDDDRFLECAEAARADYLVTGNLKHVPRYWKNTKIINARELWNVIGPHLPI